MRNTLFGLFAAAILCSGVARASELSASAQDGTALYQREVRSALTKRDWRITQDETGKLTAERRRIPGLGTGDFVLADDNTYVRLMIDFRADGKNHTISSARASLIIYEPLSSSKVGFTAYPPLALRDPKLTQEYRDILAEADSHLAAGYHTYGALGTSGLQKVGSSSKVAMK